MSIDWENVEPTPLARELHERFCAKMAQGGEIDQILNGRQPVAKLAPAPDAEIELRKRQIEVQLGEYGQALRAYAGWCAAWFGRHPKVFRAKRRKGEAAQ